MAAYTEEEVIEVIARQKCYDVLTRYCRALDRCDLELMKSVYWEDAVDQHGIYEGNAQEFSEYIIREIRNWFTVATHYICNVHMDYQGDRMLGESYLLSYCQVENRQEIIEAVQGPAYFSSLRIDESAGGHQAFIVGGRYLDRLEKRDGEWRIALRQVVMDWNENASGCCILDEGMFRDLVLRGTRGREDPVYKLKL